MKDSQPHAMDVETSVISIRRAPSVGSEGRCLTTNNTTYATVVAPSTSTSPTQLENATYGILRNNAENPVDHTPPNIDVPRHVDDTCIEDTDLPQTVEPESYRVHIDAQSETTHQQQKQQNQMEQDTDTIMEDAVHNATTKRENRELRQQSKVHKHEHIEQQTGSMDNCSDKGNKTIEGMDTELPHQDKEGAQGDMTSSPKTPKKMKVEETGEPQNERSRSSTRRTVHKDRKS